VVNGADFDSRFFGDLPDRRFLVPLIDKEPAADI
jgi:hypothetical protein